MKHMTWGAVALLGAASLAGCYSYAADGVNNHNFNLVQTTPIFSVVKVGDSDQIVVRLVNDNNTGTTTSYNVTNVGTGIAVHFLSTYRPMFSAKTDSLVPTGDKNAQVYYVVGLALGRYSFTVTPTSVNTGVSTTVNVLVQPNALTNALSKHTAVPGDTIVITAPAGLVFSQTSAVSFGTGSAATIVSRAPDSTSITVIVGAGVTGPATVTLVSQPAGTVTPPVTLVTSDSLVSTPFPAPIPVTVNANTFPLGGKLIVTLGSGLRFNANSTISIGQATGTAFAILTTDSTQASITVPAGQNDTVSVSNVYFANYRPGTAATSAGLFSGKTNAVVTTTAPPIIAPTTLSATTAVAGTTVTATLGGGLRFSKGSHVLVGGADAPITTFSTDSLTATFVAPVAAVGANQAVSYTGIVTLGAPTLPFTLNSDGKVLTVTAPTNIDANAGSSAAPTVLTLNPNGSVVVTDAGLLTTTCNAGLAGAFGGTATCRYYTVTLAAGATSASINWNPVSADLGVFLLNGAGTACSFTLADNNGAISGTTGDAATQPLNCAESANATVTAGTYTVAVVKFSGGTLPSYYQFKISQP